MIHYLISGIPSMLFEPIAICALIALVIALVVFWKHHGRFYWIIAGTILFIFVWRFACYNKNFSTRYSSILLYPAIVLSAWLFVYVQEFAEKKGFLSSGKRNLIFVICIGALTIASIAKTLHYNPYDDHTVKICKTLRGEISKGNYRLFANVEHDRIAYYAKVPRNKVEWWDGSLGLLKNILIRNRNFKGMIYVIVFLKKHEPEPDAEHLKLDPKLGKWECIHREYTSRRKNKEIVLYRFTSAHPNVEVWEKPIPPMSPDNKCFNGDFEKYITGNELKDRLAYYKKIKASDFYTKQNNLFPTHWWLGVGGAVNGKSPTMALTADHPIAGKYSLEMNDRGIGWTGLNSGWMPKQDGIFIGFIRARKDSYVQIFSCYWNGVKKDTSFIDSVKFNASAGKTYKFTLPVRKADVPPKDNAIYIIVQTPGHILMDQVQFIPVKKNPGRDNVKRQNISGAKTRK